MSDTARLKQKAFGIIDDPDNVLFLSSVTPWEISTKRSIGKLKVPNDLRSQLRKNYFSELKITFEHALEVEKLPLHHKNPFDRMLIAQAKVEGLTIITNDKIFKKYKVPVII